MKHTRALRRTFFLFLAIVWLVGVGITWIWFRLVASGGYPEPVAVLAALEDSASVDYDSLGIPTIGASGELDAWRALGYVHASDRLWQMEFFRRIGSGRLAEVFGPQAVATDRFTRTLGLPQIARHADERLGAGDREALDAYAQGVNARLAGDDPLPPEFRILRFTPEPWTRESSLSIALVMNLDLSHWRRDVSRHWAARHLDSARVAYLHPRYPSWGPVTLDGLSEPPPGIATGFGRAVGAEAPPLRTPSDVRGSLNSWDPFEVLGAASIRIASNAWVVGSSRTASGNPIVANDMHLALRAPSIWYIAALHGAKDDLHVAGFTLPGIPGVVVGFNRHIAWGATNGMVDDADFVVEELSADESLYRDGAEWLEVITRVDSIPVRGEDPQVITVRSTRRGPILSDVLEDVPDVLSVMFLPARIEMGLGGLFALNHAGSLEEFHAAAEVFGQPHLNLVVGATDGRIGYHLAGSIPVRTWDGAFPVPGNVAGDGWPGVWPADAHPSATAPLRDYIATANNLQMTGLDGAIGADFPVPFRALRLTQALAVRRDWTIESTSELQRDVRSLLADRGIDRAVAAARRVGDDQTAKLLASWNREVDVGSRAAPVFYTWFYGLRSRVAFDEWQAAPSRSFFPIMAMLRVLEEGDASPWVDDVGTPERESLARLEEDALRAAVQTVGGRSWGELHTELHVHPLGRNALLDRLFGFNVGPYPSEGGPNTLRPDAYQDWHALNNREGPVPPWSSQYGPSERMVTELTERGPRGFVVIPTGQSGNPFSRHYDDMLPLWRSGRMVPLSLDERHPTAAVRTLVLRPPAR
ncbi:MAG: penicillin acylase family protein [Gemmatimonadota bacterium]|nr:penicillin acylase family protein [Gemmatimonadota bacterium]